MNYQGLKAMIESLVKTYKCPECSSEVENDSVDIVGAAGSTVNIDIECPKCKKHSMIKAEILSVDIGHLNFTKENVEKLKENLGYIKGALAKNLPSSSKTIKSKSIKDIQITELNKDLKTNKLNASDLFGEGQ